LLPKFGIVSPYNGGKQNPPILPVSLLPSDTGKRSIANARRAEKEARMYVLHSRPAHRVILKHNAVLPTAVHAIPGDREAEEDDVHGSMVVVVYAMIATVLTMAALGTGVLIAFT
jgi:hypothetical protein